LLGRELFRAAGIASHAELSDPDGVSLVLELLAAVVVLRMAADASGITESGRRILVVIARVRVRVMMHDAPPPLRVMGLRTDVVRVGDIRLNGLPGAIAGWGCTLISRILTERLVQVPTVRTDDDKQSESNSSAAMTRVHERSILKRVCPLAAGLPAHPDRHTVLFQRTRSRSPFAIAKRAEDFHTGS
jgi:hypothetical protein